MICGEGALDGLPVVVAVFDFAFMGGSMGSVVGEKITRAIELGLENGVPVLIFLLQVEPVCRKASCL